MNNQKLDSLELDGNKLTIINLNNINNISWLNINGNGCKELKFNSIKQLTTFLCNENKLKKLNLKNNSKLQRIECDNGGLSGKGLLPGNKPVLDKLICSNNNLTGIDISKCPYLKSKLVNPNLQYDNEITIKTTPDISQ